MSRANPFTSQIDGMRRAKPRYFCLCCDREIQKTESCSGCGHKPERFDSTSEFKAWMTRRLLQMAGEITDLKPHPKMLVKINGQKFCTYTPDWQYRNKAGELVYEDFKGSRAHATAASNLRRKAAELYYGITITIVEK